LSVNVIAPVRVPVAAGAKVTEIVQLAFAATLDPQVFVCEKSPEPAMPLMERGTVPVLLKVTSCAALVVPTVLLANDRLLEDKLTTGKAA
jgi:hypothetical protein